MTIEEQFPLDAIQPIAKVESQRRQFYRPIYSIHKSWARRPGSTIRAIGLSQFSQEVLFDPNRSGKGAFYQNHDFRDKIALDPFCGGGTTIVELHRLGIKTIGIDVNPIAWLTTKKEMDPFNIELFDQEVEKLFQSVGRQIKTYYKTVCPNCASSNADIMYIFWVRTIFCPSCHSEEDLFKYYIIGKKQRKDPATMVICPSCKNLFYTMEKLDELSTCPTCSHDFIPKLGNCRLKLFTCTNCQKEYRLLELLQQTEHSLSARQIAIEFFCQACGTRDYKQASERDKDKFVEVQREFRKREDNLQFPRELLPEEGKNVSNLRNYGFKRFSDLFNERQLLSLSLLLKAISQVSDQNIKEFLLMAFSSSLEFHTVICPYNYTMKQIVNVFNYQSFLVPTMYVENNVWGTKKGNGTFITYLERIKKAKEYCKSPFEIAFQNNTIVRIPIAADKIEANSVETFQMLQAGSKADTLLIADTSENLQRLGIPQASVDIIVTDPPYFNYIQYSELANFFYVWLKIVLTSQYPFFRSALIPTDREVSTSREKEKFLEKITRIFQECYKVLKPDAPMVFTFHHSNVTAWMMILEALKCSLFQITAAFPVQSEFRARPVKGRNFDIILICRKTPTKIHLKESMDWKSLELEVIRKVEDSSTSPMQNQNVATWEEIFSMFLPKIAENYNRDPLVNLEEILSNIFNHLKGIKM
ncbi:MAG: DNA methyltransferase [Promethearchaeota archaeon]